MMIEAKTYKGIDYVQLDELPQTQQERILQTLNNDLLIKIMIDGKIIKNCLQYKDYAFWYNSVFKSKSLQPETAEAAEAPEVQFEGKLAFK
jgi:hypothetical protein